MQEPIDLRKIAEDVEREYGLGGLSGGTLYEDFAVDVAKRAIQTVARDCANICKARNMGDGSREDQEAVRCHDAICARFGLEG